MPLRCLLPGPGGPCHLTRQTIRLSDGACLGSSPLLHFLPWHPEPSHSEQAPESLPTHEEDGIPRGDRSSRAGCRVSTMCGKGWAYRRDKGTIRVTKDGAAASLGWGGGTEGHLSDDMGHMRGPQRPPLHPGGPATTWALPGQRPVVPTLLPAQPGSVPLQPPASTASPLPPLVSVPEQHSAGLAASPQQRLSGRLLSSGQVTGLRGTVGPGPLAPTPLILPVLGLGRPP